MYVPQKGVQQQVHGRQSGENLPQRSVLTSTSQPETLVSTLTSKWSLGAETQDPREDWGEGTPRGLIQHS